MEFENVKLVGKANVYFEGKVTSRTFYMPNGERKTVGFMLSGDYDFGTAAAEKMEILGGSIEVTLDGETTSKLYTEGQAFDVPANSRYRAVVKDYADYLCSYAD